MDRRSLEIFIESLSQPPPTEPAHMDTADLVAIVALGTVVAATGVPSPYLREKLEAVADNLRLAGDELNRRIPRRVP